MNDAVQLINTGPASASIPAIERNGPDGYQVTKAQRSIVGKREVDTVSKAGGIDYKEKGSDTVLKINLK